MATAYALLDAYGSLSADQILALLDDGFQQQGLPESLGMPARSKEEFRGHAAAGRHHISLQQVRQILQADYEDEIENAVVSPRENERWTELKPWCPVGERVHHASSPHERATTEPR